MPVNRLGKASVDVEANTAGFGRGLNAKLKAALEGTEREAKRAGKRIGKELTDGIANEVLRQAPSIRRRINLILRGIRLTARLHLDVEVEVDRGQLGSLIARTTGQLRGEILGPLQSASNGMRGLFRGLIPTSLQGLAVMVTSLSFLATILAGAFNATGRELLNVVKLSAFLPAGLSVLLATAAAVKIGLTGVGDALEAVFSRDPEKLNEALKKLTPSARSFVLEFRKALPILDQIKSKTQESLFAPLKGVVTKILASIGPTLTTGLASVAGSVGTLLASVGNVLGNPATQLFLSKLFTSTSGIITTLSGPISNLINALVSAASKALPALERMVSGGLGGFIQKLADWLNAAISDGRFQGWLDSAQRTLGDIVYIIEQLIGLFAVLFDDANKEGDSFLRIVGDMIKDFKDFAASKEGEYAMKGIATTAAIAGGALLGIVWVIGVIVAAIGSLVAAVQDALAWLGRLAEKAGSAVGLGGNNSKWMPAGTQGYADGGIIRRPELATIGESGDEVVIPLTRPNRARQLARQSGLDKMLGSGGGGSVTQVFYLGEEQVEARIVRTVDSRVDSAVTDASYGTRAA